MNKFKTLLLTILSIAALSFTACDDSTDAAPICPQCNMPLGESREFTSHLDIDSKVEYFDDIGCMILWAKEKNIDLNSINSKIFTNDTKRYADAKSLKYSINERTPMSYGFGAYENGVKDAIEFDEVILRMLRGENMANPKIRKQILGR